VITHDQAALARDGDLGLAVDQGQCALGQRERRLLARCASGQARLSGVQELV